MLDTRSALSPSSGSHWQALVSFAQDWGFACELLSVDGRAPYGNDDLIEGALATADIRGGVRMCVSALRSLSDNKRAGDLTRGLTMILPVDGSPLDYMFGRRQRVMVDAGRIASIAVHDEARLVARYRRGDSTRLVVLSVSPDGLDDAELADEVDRCLARSRAWLGPAGDRTCALAHELFTPRYSGVVGRLLAESVALEMIAVALDPPSDKATGPARPSDVARMLRVRDLLLADLRGEHSLASLAREAGVSVSTLKSKFRAVVGQPLFAFLRDQRLERARRGLEQDGWTVAQASEFVGYRHPTNFATAFRKKFGIPPQQAMRG